MHLSGKHSAVVSSDSLATNVGVELLRRGGNAVDAAVGAMLAECVVQPHNVGIGGYGGAMIIWLGRSRRAVCIDFDSVAPQAAAADVFGSDARVGGGENGPLPAMGPANEFGYLAVSVPANVAGLALALRKYGSMSWAEASRPARELAERGFPVYPGLALALKRFAELADEDSRSALLGDGKVPAEDDLFVQRDLARLLDGLAAEGPEAFYGPEIAGHIAKHVEEHGGILHVADFATYAPVECEPVSVQCGTDLLCTPGLPAGGATALQIVLAMHELGPDADDYRSGRYHHCLIEVSKQAWIERLELMGDPRFAEDPTPRLLSAAHIRQMLPHVPETVGRYTPVPRADPDAHTVHVVAADTDRNLVSLAATQGGHFGSRVVIGGLGLVMGHGMSRFDPVPGRPNSIEPGKRMLHNMSPMLLLGNGEPRCVFGLPGGRKIVNVAAQMGLGFIEYGMLPAEAIGAPRVHTEGHEPVIVDASLPGNIVDFLESRGHRLERTEQPIGNPASAIVIDPENGALLAASQIGEEAVGML